MIQLEESCDFWQTDLPPQISHMNQLTWLMITPLSGFLEREERDYQSDGKQTTWIPVIQHLILVGKGRKSQQFVWCRLIPRLLMIIIPLTYMQAVRHTMYACGPVCYTSSIPYHQLHVSCNLHVDLYVTCHMHTSHSIEAHNITNSSGTSRLATSQYSSTQSKG